MVKLLCERRGKVGYLQACSQKQGHSHQGWMETCTWVQDEIGSPAAVQWCTSVIPAPGMLKQKDWEFGVNLDYTVRVFL